MKDCPSNKIYNPITNRCIDINGVTAKKLEKLKLIVNKNPKMKNCLSHQILNIKTNRCVNKSGTIGKKILKNNKIPNYLKWENNSCYIDSLLVALFHSKTKFIEKILLNAPINNYDNSTLNDIGERIRKELINIYNSVSFGKNEIEYCSLLRKLLDKYYRILINIKPKIKIISSRDNWSTSQIDVFELLEFLTTIFDIKNTTKIIDANNPPVYTNFINLISVDFLLSNETLNISDIYPSYSSTFNLSDNDAYIDSYGNKHTTYIKKTEIIKAPFLMIRVARNIGRMKLSTNIIPTPYLKLKENTHRLKLNSIIIHYGSNKGGHYISLIKHNNKWYEYNDLKGNLTKIGSLTEIINNDKYTSNIVGLVYI